MKDRIIQPEEFDIYYASLTPLDIFKSQEVIEARSASEFNQYAYHVLFIISFDWMAWEEGKEFYLNGKKGSHWDFSDKDPYFCFRMMSTICRADRFNEGMLSQALRNGFMEQLFTRLKQLV